MLAGRGTSFCTTDLRYPRRRRRTAQRIKRQRVVLKTGSSPTTVDIMAMIERTQGAAFQDVSAQGARRRRFFWGVLIFSTLTSIAGNVTHALLQARGNFAVAAAVAVMPPIFLLLATESVGILVRSPRSDRLNRAAVMLTVAVTIGIGAFAFRLSFDALKELAIGAGVRSGIAWLWPLSVDLSIAQATLALMALDRSQMPPREPKTRISGSPASAQRPLSQPSSPQEGVQDKHHTARDVSEPEPSRQTAAVTTPPQATNVADINHLHRRSSSAEMHFTAPLHDDKSPQSDGWVALAETLIRDKVTVKPVDKTAQVLRLWDQRIPTTTIATRTGVHRDTVSNIVRAAESLMASADHDRMHA